MKPFLKSYAVLDLQSSRKKISVNIRRAANIFFLKSIKTATTFCRLLFQAIFLQTNFWLTLWI